MRKQKGLKNSLFSGIGIAQCDVKLYINACNDLYEETKGEHFLQILF